MYFLRLASSGKYHTEPALIAFGSLLSITKYKIFTKPVCFGFWHRDCFQSRMGEVSILFH